MNTFIKTLILTFLLAAAFLPASAQIGYIQIVHNCADPALDTIDLYFNGNNVNDVVAFEDSNVVYHTATGLIAYPIDTAFTIGIARKHSGGNLTDSLIQAFSFPSGTLTENKRSAFILSGVNSGNFAPNPDGLDTALNIFQVDDLDSIALDTSSVLLDTAFVSLRFFQGATDLPGIKIRFRNGGLVFSTPDSLLYGDNAQDVSLHHGYYEFQVVNPTDTTQNFGTYSANLSGLGGQPLIILCSGFVNIDSTDSTSAFGLYALLNTGGVIPLPLEATGFQLLNNAADTATDSVDIYIDGKKVFPNLGFRNATPALVFKAYCTYHVAITHKNSTSLSSPIWSQAFYFPRDTFFILTATGLLSQTGYAPNPDGISTAFNVLIKSPAEFDASSQQNFDFYMINGVTDAPALDLVPQGGPYLLTDVEYADQTHYVSLPSEFYDLYVQDTSGNTLESGFANFLAFQSQSAVLLTSGFLNPADNNDGPAMGLFMAPTTGGPFIPLYSPEGIRKIDTGSILTIFPNPAANLLHVVFTLPQPENVSLQVTDINGNLVKQVLTQTQPTGAQNITIDLNGLSEGIYFTRLVTSEGSSNSRFAIVR